MFASISTQGGSTEGVTNVTLRDSTSFSQAVPTKVALDLPGPLLHCAPESDTHPLLISCHCKGYMKSADGVAQQLFKTTLNLAMK